MHNPNTCTDGWLLFTTFAICFWNWFVFFCSSVFFSCVFFYRTFTHCSFSFSLFFFYRQSSAICRIDCGACKCSNYFGNIIWALLCDLWTVKSWLRLHKNPSADDMSGCLGGCCNFYKVINIFFFFCSVSLFVREKNKPNSVFTNRVCI